MPVGHTYHLFIERWSDASVSPEGREAMNNSAKYHNTITHEPNERTKQMKYFIEYDQVNDDSKMWEELTEDEFIEICFAQRHFEPDIYFVQLTGPTLVIRSKS